MAQGRFPIWLKWAWRPENDGQGYHNTVGDPGGSTNRGVIFATYQGVARQQRKPVPTLHEFAAASNDDLAEILHIECWNAVRADDLPEGIDLLVADAAMMSHATSAARVLQQCLFVKQDGMIGPITIAAANKSKPDELAVDFADRYEAYLGTLADAPLFINGWRRRVDSLLAEEQVEIAAEQPAPPADQPVEEAAQ